MSSPPKCQLHDPGDLVCLVPHLYPPCPAQCLVHGRCSIRINQVNAVTIQSWAHFQVFATVTFSLSIHGGLISCGLNLQCCYQSLADAKLCAKRSCISLKDHEQIFQHHLEITKCHTKTMLSESSRPIESQLIFFNSVSLHFFQLLWILDYLVNVLSVLTLNFISMKAN